MSAVKQKPIVVTEANDKSTIKANAGAPVVVQLPAQLGTGYGWQVEKSSLQPVAQSQENAHAEQRAGGTDLQVFRFAPRKKGTYLLKFRYVRAWTADQPPAKTFSVTLRVR